MFSFVFRLLSWCFLHRAAPVTPFLFWCSLQNSWSGAIPRLISASSGKEKKKTTNFFPNEKCILDTKSCPTNYKSSCSIPRANSPCISEQVVWALQTRWAVLFQPDLDSNTTPRRSLTAAVSPLLCPWEWHIKHREAGSPDGRSHDGWQPIRRNTP